MSVRDLDAAAATHGAARQEVTNAER